MLPQNVATFGQHIKSTIIFQIAFYKSGAILLFFCPGEHDQRSSKVCYLVIMTIIYIGHFFSEVHVIYKYNQSNVIVPAWEIPFSLKVFIFTDVNLTKNYRVLLPTTNIYIIQT